MWVRVACGGTKYCDGDMRVSQPPQAKVLCGQQWEWQKFNRGGHWGGIRGSLVGRLNEGIVLKPRAPSIGC